MRLATILCVLVLAPLAAATHQSPDCEPATTVPDHDLHEHGLPFYVDFDWGYEWWGFWVYEETNGLAGLQRSDPIQDDTCGHPELADTVVV